MDDFSQYELFCPSSRSELWRINGIANHNEH
jgi:hypothetical protein